MMMMMKMMMMMMKIITIIIIIIAFLRRRLLVKTKEKKKKKKKKRFEHALQFIHSAEQSWRSHIVHTITILYFYIVLFQLWTLSRRWSFLAKTCPVSTLFIFLDSVITLNIGTP